MTNSMLSLSTFVLSLSTFAGNPPPQPVRSPKPPVRVWLSERGDFRYGDRARAFIETQEDGYVVVLQVDTDGRIRPLFPLQPGEDHYVRAGKKLEIRGHGGREAFVVDDTTGRGTVIAAFSKSAFVFTDFERNGHWDYRALTDSAAAADPEAALMDVVNRMQPAERFQYDLVAYVVSSSRYLRRGGMYPYPRPGIWWDSYYYGRPRVSISVGFGSRFGWGYPYYRSYRRPFGWWGY